MIIYEKPKKLIEALESLKDFIEQIPDELFDQDIVVPGEKGCGCIFYHLCRTPQDKAAKLNYHKGRAKLDRRAHYYIYGYSKDIISAARELGLSIPKSFTKRDAIKRVTILKLTKKQEEIKAGDL